MVIAEGGVGLSGWATGGRRMRQVGDHKKHCFGANLPPRSPGQLTQAVCEDYSGVRGGCVAAGIMLMSVSLLAHPMPQVALTLSSSNRGTARAMTARFSKNELRDYQAFETAYNVDQPSRFCLDSDFVLWLTFHPSIAALSNLNLSVSFSS